MRLDQAKQLKELEKETARLKWLVANLSLENQTLEEAAQGEFQAHRSDERQFAGYARSWESVNNKPVVC